MHADLVAYAEDCIIRGVIALTSGRLTDQLAGDGPLHLTRATLTALEDGRLVEAGELELSRDDLYAAAAVGPRGDTERRIRTRPHGLVIGMGPYHIVGYAHAAPTADPLAVANRRQAIPLTDATISFGGVQQAIESHDVLILNRRHVDWVEHATGADLRLADRSDLRVPGEGYRSRQTAGLVTR